MNIDYLNQIKLIFFNYSNIRLREIKIVKENKLN